MDEGSRRKLLGDTLIVRDRQDMLSKEEPGQTDIGDFKVDGSSLEGTVSNEKEGFLLLTIPDQEGWEIYVDEEKETIIMVIMDLLQ